MAKKATALAPGNDYNGKEINAFLNRILECHEEKAQLNIVNAGKHEKVNKRIVGIYLEAKEAGIPKKALKAQVDVELLQQKIVAKLDDMEPEDRDEVRFVAEARNGTNKAASASYTIQENLFGWTKENRPKRKKPDAKATKAKGKTDDADPEPGGDGSELTANGEPPVGVTGDKLSDDGGFKPLH